VTLQHKEDFQRMQQNEDLLILEMDNTEKERELVKKEQELAFQRKIIFSTWR
jgi:hypothetical protein